MKVQGDVICELWQRHLECQWMAPPRILLRRRRLFSNHFHRIVFAPDKSVAITMAFFHSSETFSKLGIIDTPAAICCRVVEYISVRNAKEFPGDFFVENIKSGDYFHAPTKQPL